MFMLRSASIPSLYTAVSSRILSVPSKPSAASVARRWMTTETGVVKFYLRRKAYGFIIRDSTGEEAFVHRTSIVGAQEGDPFNPFLISGERLKFSIEQGNDGKIIASSVTFEDGSMVPKIRDDVREFPLVCCCST